MAIPVTGDMLRRAMRDVPSPVVVVTANVEGELRGITIGSFTSVSLHPPLVSFNVQKAASTHEVISTNVTLAVHLLKSDQADVSANFAVPERSGEEQFAGIDYETHPHGPPILPGVLSVLICRPRSRHDAGDHSLFICEVTSIDEKEEGKPLLYFRRTYRDVGREVGSNRLDPMKSSSNEAS